MKKTNHLIFIGLIAVGLASCATNNLKHAKHMQQNLHSHHSKPQNNLYALKENQATKMSKQGNYNVSLYSNESPIPMSRIHTWTVHIERPNGEPVGNAKVYVFGGMPMHNHDFPTVPKAKKYLGNGDYLVEGIKFSMLGHWEMRFNIKEGRKQDRVVFEVQM